MLKEKDNGGSNTKEVRENSNSNNNNSNGHMNLSAKALERYRRNRVQGEETEIHKSGHTVQ
jgi:hypothetical protein